MPELLKTFSGTNVRLFLSNMYWYGLENGIRMVLGLVTGFLLAAYLGPTQLGIYSYALAFIGFFAHFISLGYDGYLKSDLLLETEQRAHILGSSVFLRLTGGLLAIALIWLITAVFPVMQEAVVYIRIAALVFLFQAADVPDLFFRAIAKPRYAASARIIAATVAAGLKIYFIVIHASLMAFVLIVLVEAALAAALLLYYYIRHAEVKLLQWRISPQRLRFILSQSLPLLINAISYFIYMRIDQIMLGQMRSAEELGLYAASVKFFEIPLAGLVIIHSVLHPFQVKHFSQGNAVFMRNLRLVAEALSVAAIIITILGIVLAPLMMGILPQVYSEAAILLQIEFVGLLFLFNGSVREIYFNVHRRQTILVWITISSALLNIVLNYFFITAYGAAGAAWATVITQAFAFLILHAFWKSVRPLFFLQLRSLWPSEWIRLLRKH